jgi:Domain of Unknown Function (DUF1080)/FHA domain
MRVACLSLALLQITIPAAARDNTLSQPEAQQGWILLFDGRSLYGWSPQGGAQWRVDAGKIVADSGSSGFLLTNSQFADFDLKCDFLVKGEGESGILLRVNQKSNPLATGDKLQINNNDKKFPTGSLVGDIRAANVPIAPDEWHSYEVQAQGSQFIVRLDGNEVASGNARGSKAGAIGLQFVSRTPVEFKNIKLIPLGLGSIFNGQTLYQWTEVGGRTAPQKKGLLKKFIPLGGRGRPAAWTVRDGAIHVRKGPSELETSAAYGDFVLQLDVRADARSRKDRPSGGIYIRADKAVEHTGYKVEIQNEPPQSGGANVVRAGTGGLASIRPARGAAGQNNQFFKLTVVADGHHLATWVNGYQTMDFEDTRMEGPDALIQARSTPGPLRLAADNASSSLDFKGIEIAPLPEGGPPAMASQALPSASGLGRTSGQAAAPGGAGIASGTPARPAGPPANPNDAEIARLTQQAVATSDPATQASLYKQVLALDPNNVVAYNGLKDAQGKLDQEKAQQARANDQKAAEEAAAQRQQQQASANERTKDQAIKQAETAFSTGNLPAAAYDLALAKNVAPFDPKVLELESLLQSERWSRQRRRWLEIGLGLAVLACLVALLVLNFRRRQPYLDLVDGIGQGKRCRLDQDVIHIGAVAQDGGRKNEIVVADVDRSISRFHCEIHRQNGKFWLVDCNSANGTYYNGHRVSPDKPKLLKKGGKVQLAEACTLRLKFGKPKADKS